MKKSDLAIDRNGDLLVLVTTADEPFFILTRCNSRGESPEVIEIADIHKVVKNGTCFKPSAIRCQDGLVFLLDHETYSLIAIDEAGHCVGKITSLENCANIFIAEGEKESFHMIWSGRPSLLSRVCAALDRMAPWITKPSSSRNETDPAKTPYSRNGLWIDRYEN